MLTARIYRPGADSVDVPADRLTIADSGSLVIYDRAATKWDKIVSRVFAPGYWTEVTVEERETT